MKLITFTDCKKRVFLKQPEKKKKEQSMADEEHENVAGGAGEDEWTELIDIGALDDGPTTTFVGGFSSTKTIDDALEGLVNYNDRIVVLGKVLKGDLKVDSTRFDGVQILAGGSAETIVEGRLVLTYSTPGPGIGLKRPAQAAAEDDQDTRKGGEGGLDGEDGAPPQEEEAAEGAELTDKEPVRPSILTVKNLTFTNGCIVEGLAKGDILDCTFGVQTGEVVVDHCAATHALSGAEFVRCKFFGSKRSAVYNFPFSRTKFTDCTIRGTTRPPPAGSTDQKRQKRGYIPPPPPPPTAPQKTECDVGIYNDNAEVTIANCSISNFDVGVLFNDACKGCSVIASKVSEIATVGYLVSSGGCPKLSKCQALLCGRECFVSLENTHPSVRDCIFVGNARIKNGCVMTGMTDNLLGLGGTVVVEDQRFTAKGFKSVPNDPTIVKVKKVVAED